MQHYGLTDNEPDLIQPRSTNILPIVTINFSGHLWGLHIRAVFLSAYNELRFMLKLLLLNV